MFTDHLPYLVSPVNGKPLRLSQEQVEGGRIRSGVLSDGSNEWPIRDFVPRFSDLKDDSFSVQWRLHPSIMTKTSGLNLYETRFQKETRWPQQLSGETILEGGCGVGSFTEVALQTGATVVAFDLSSSVDVAAERLGDNPHLLLLQADIYSLPLKREFDRAFSFGVLQHTPDPERSFQALVSKVKQGGHIATDIYADVPFTFRHGLLRTKYFLRRWTAGAESKRLHDKVVAYVNMAWPACMLLQKVPGGLVLSQHLMIDDYSQRQQGMRPEHFKEYAVLEIFDMLGPMYDNPATIDAYRQWHEEAGLMDVDVGYGFNGLEGRARLAA
jgi:2-polyprenyl-3-methyl-5-hydroxy-6-metoxy-1,4-benzoquinol methylase